MNKTWTVVADFLCPGTEFDSPEEALEYLRQLQNDGNQGARILSSDCRATVAELWPEEF